MSKEIKLDTVADARLTEVTHLGAGEGFGTYLGRFDGKPAFIVDNGGRWPTLPAHGGERVRFVQPALQPTVTLSINRFHGRG